MKKLLAWSSLVLLAVVLVSIVPACGPRQAAPPLVLLTDLGTDDYRVPRMKGTIYSTNPDANVVDATHNIPAFDIMTGAYILEVAAREFPEKTVFVAVVAPSSQQQRFIALTTSRRQMFVAPDNGLLTYVIRGMGAGSIFEINNEKLLGAAQSGMSAHQVLGKAGALLASGRSPGELGPEVKDPVILPVPEAAFSDGVMSGAVVFVDHFGNSLTNIPLDMAGQAGLKPGDRLTLTVAEGTIPATFGTRYGDVPVNRAVVLINKLGTVEVAINRGDFAGAHNLKPGARIAIEKSAADISSTLSRIRQRLQGALAAIDADLSSAAQKLSGVELAGAEARAVLKDLAARYPYVVDFATIDLAGKLAALEPQQYKGFEGTDISQQEQVIRLHQTKQPVLSNAFRAVEGFDAVDLEWPVFGPKGDLAGSVSALIKPEDVFSKFAAPVIAGTSFELIAIQLDGRLLYDADTSEIGKNTFTDPDYQSYSELLAMAKRVVKESSGSGSYRFLNKGMSSEVKKDAVWATVGLHGTEWRVVLAQAAP